MWKRKKFRIVLEVFKHGYSDNKNVLDLNVNECLNDGLKSNHNENVRDQKGEGSTATWWWWAASSSRSHGTSPRGSPRLVT